MSEVTKKVKKWQLVKPDAAPRGDSSYVDGDKSINLLGTLLRPKSGVDSWRCREIVCIWLNLFFSEIETFQFAETVHCTGMSWAGRGGRNHESPQGFSTGIYLEAKYFLLLQIFLLTEGWRWRGLPQTSLRLVWHRQRWGNKQGNFRWIE